MSSERRLFTCYYCFLQLLPAKIHLFHVWCMQAERHRNDEKWQGGRTAGKSINEHWSLFNEQ